MSQTSSPARRPSETRYGEHCLPACVCEPDEDSCTVRKCQIIPKQSSDLKKAVSMVMRRGKEKKRMNRAALMTEMAKNSKSGGFMILLFQERIENGLRSFPAYFHIFVFFFLSLLIPSHKTPKPHVTSGHGATFSFSESPNSSALREWENGVMFN